MIVPSLYFVFCGNCPFWYSEIRCLASWTLRGSPSSLLPNTGVHLPVGPGQGRYIGGSGGISVSQNG